MLSFVAILATLSPIICSGFRYFNLGYLWTTWRQLLHNCSNKYCFFYVLFSVPFSHRPSMGICLESSDADGANKPQRVR
ncbi:hypothetical protein FYV08_23190 [Escherichia coli]|nr:hypothetical protein [Escherichia coli]EEU9352130.1 hypothetical protein [Escherichia coli]